MSAFDQYADTPNQLQFEGQDIVITFDRKSASTATISWNIPRKSSRCSSDNPPAYDGIVITMGPKHTNSAILPSDESVYIGDPTADLDLHAGDVIGSSLVVGAFYGDRETTSLDVTGLTANTPYYISGHAVDKQLRYHTTGVHAYSQNYGNKKESGTTAKQNIRVGSPDIGVLASDPTGLLIGENYYINTTIDCGTDVILTISGDNAQTYGEFVDEWQQQVLLMDNPPMSAIHPNTGSFYWDSANYQLLQWNGTSNDLIPVIVTDQQPTVPNVGSFWSDGTKLSEWNGSSWIPQFVFDTSFDPVSQGDCSTYWSDGLSVYSWTGTVWVGVDSIESTIDPSGAPVLPRSAHWYNEVDYTLYRINSKCCGWNQTIAQLWSSDPSIPNLDQYWFNETAREIKQWDGSAWVATNGLIVDELPRQIPTGSLYYIEDEMELYKEIGGKLEKVEVFVWDTDPTAPKSGDLWWNESTNELFQWSGNQIQWIQIQPFFLQENDPRDPPVLEVGVVWSNQNEFKQWDGSEWTDINVTVYPSDPLTLSDGVFWNDGTQFKRLVAGQWTDIDVITNPTNPQTPTLGSYWYNTATNALHQYNGVDFVNQILLSPVDLTPKLGYKYYNTADETLLSWNGYGWIGVDPKYTVKLDGTVIRLETTDVGTSASVEVDKDSTVFLDAVPTMIPLRPIISSDGLESKPSYAQDGVGTDGSSDERRELIDSIRHQLGYPSVDVELTKQQFDYAIDGAIESLRKRSGMAYKRGFYFMDVEPRKQTYTLTDKKRGFNAIVSVLKMHRVRASFLANAEGTGLYGQIALQQMYQMGSFDLISYHMVSQYVETMNQMFAGEIMFNWNEDTRNLMLFKQFYKAERILVEVVVERTEQNMLKDRFLKGWIEKYAMCQSRLMLAEIRGKFAALPGAGGGVSLNAQELAARADQDLMDLYQQLDDYVVDNPEEYGGQFILG